MIAYFLLGCAFGAVFMEAEVVSWFRIQEMFRFDAFHMFGIIGSAVVVAGLSLIAIKSFNLRGAGGDPLGLAPKTLGNGVRYITGGTIFGLGLGAHRRLSRSARGAHRQRHAGDDRRARQRAGRHVGLRSSAPAPAALEPARIVTSS